MSRNKCGCSGGCSGSCNPRCNGKGSGGFALKFSGTTPADSGGTGTETFLADAGSAATSTTEIDYPVSSRRRVTHLSANLGTTLVAQTVTLALLKNGVAVASADLPYGGANPLSGTQTKKLATPVSLAKNDTYALRVTTTGALPSGALVTAEISGKLT